MPLTSDAERQRSDTSQEQLAQNNNTVISVVTSQVCHFKMGPAGARQRELDKNSGL